MSSRSFAAAQQAWDAMEPPSYYEDSDDTLEALIAAGNAMHDELQAIAEEIREANPDQIIPDIGDMLRRWSNAVADAQR